MIDKNQEVNGNFVGEFYDEWSEFLLESNFVNETLAIHFGYYEKGIKTLKDAILNMNDYVARLLYLKNNKNMNILDAGCGIGGSSIYLAQKYPNINFTGITIAPNQVKLANTFAQEKKVKNSKFISCNYLDTDFPDNNFDGIFALESMSYAIDRKAFLNEMYRILKPGGYLVVVDGFRTPRTLNDMMKKMYKQFCIEFGYADLADVILFEKELKDKGFEEIIVQDISKNVRKSLLQISMVAAPRYVTKMVKRVMHFGNKNKNEYKDKFIGNTILADICGLCKIMKYYGVSAKKK